MDNPVLDLTSLEIGDIVIALLSYANEARRDNFETTANSYIALADKVEAYWNAVEIVL